MQDEDFIEQKKRIMMNLMEENLEKDVKDESDNARSGLINIYLIAELHQEEKLKSLFFKDELW